MPSFSKETKVQRLNQNICSKSNSQAGTTVECKSQVVSPRASVLGTPLGARDRADDKTEKFLPSVDIDSSQRQNRDRQNIGSKC